MPCHAAMKNRWLVNELLNPGRLFSVELRGFAARCMVGFMLCLRLAADWRHLTARTTPTPNALSCRDEKPMAG
jgi:hypothetical protein